MISINKMREQLLEGFPEPQADLMARVFVSAQEELVTKAELNELTAATRELADAQERTEQRVTQLGEAQARTEQQVIRLGEAQERTEQQVARLGEAQERTEQQVARLGEAQERTEQRVTQLAEAQARTEQQVARLGEAQERTEQHLERLSQAQERTDQHLARTDRHIERLSRAQVRTDWAVRDLAKQVGGLSNALGGSLEDFACDLVPELLEKHWQMEVTSAEPEELLIGRQHREIDVVIRGAIQSKPVMVICEVKASVSLKEVEGFLALVDRFRAAHPDDEIRSLFFGYKADRKARDKIVKSGAAMIFTRGVMIPQPA